MSDRVQADLPRVLHVSAGAVLPPLPLIRRRYRRVLLEPGIIEEPSRQRMEQLLNRDLRACGCETGAVFMVASLLGYTVWLYWSRAYQSVPLWQLALASVALVILAGGLGKMVGLSFARWRFAFNLRKLESAMRLGAVAT